MKRMTWVGLFCALALISASCSSDDGRTPETTASSGASDTAGPPTNQRGAIEVGLGQPVEVTTGDGELVLGVTGTRLDADGCTPAHPEVAQSKFVATIETGTQPMMTQWLWSSDMYYVDAAGKVVQNIDVAEAADSYTPCTGSTQFIDIPPNSTAAGSPTLTIPLNAVAIGYHLEAGDVDQRIEWTLPADWAPALQPPAVESSAPEQEPSPTEEPAPPATGDDAGAAGTPSEWDKDGDGLIDTDAPIGDTECTTAECLIAKNEQGAVEAEGS